MKILISSCLLGENVRYDGKNSSKHISNQALFNKIIKNCEVYSFCPEVEGGLEIPRVPAEIVKNKVINKNNIDVTSFFNKGAQKALNLCKENEIKVALLKANSPSCGNEKVYDGTFSNSLKVGQGISVKLLEKNHIKVFNENELEKLEIFIN